MWLRFGLGAAVAALGWLIPSVVSAAGLSVTSQFSGPTPLQGVTFVDAQTGWAVGGTCASGDCSGVVLSTADGGAHWLPLASGLSAALTDVSFVDTTHGWAAGEACPDPSCASPRGAVLRTSDGGAHWSAQAVGDVPPLSAIHFVDGTHGWAVGTSPGVLLSTDDGGATWRATTPSQAAGLSKVTATDPDHAWALSDASVFALGADGSWTGHPVGGQALRGLTFVDPQHGWVIGGDGQVYGTADGGSTWSPQGTVSSAVTGVGFGDPLHGLAVGPSTMSDSVDGGKTWSNVEPGASNLGDLAAVATPDASHWWAVGHDGSIYAAAFPDASGSAAGGGGGGGGGGGVAPLGPSTGSAGAASPAINGNQGSGSPDDGDASSVGARNGASDPDGHGSTADGADAAEGNGAHGSPQSGPSDQGPSHPTSFAVTGPTGGHDGAPQTGGNDPTAGIGPGGTQPHGDPPPSTVSNTAEGSPPSSLRVAPDSVIGEPPSPAATPELDSLTLLGTGLLGLGGYALLRLRARR